MRAITLAHPLVALTLAGCGGEPSGTAINNAAAPAPTSYGIRQADLSRDPPADICRVKRPAFLEGLMKRVGRALPPAVASTMAFRDFNVTDGYEGKGREAVLRFIVDRDGRQGVLMYAAGDFDPANCDLSRIRAGVGAAPGSGTEEISVP